MKRLLLLAILLACPLIAEAQVTSTPVVFVTSAPTVCQPKKLYSLTTNGNLYERLGSSGTTCTLIVNAAGGVISGTGTTNTITKWTSATALGNALMTDDGSLIVAAVTPTTGDGFSITGATVTTGNLVSIAASGTAAASNTKTALRVATSGANATNAMTTFGAVISNTSTNGTSGTNIALQLTASGATTANTALNVTAGQSVFPDGSAGVPSLRGSDDNSGIYFSSNNTLFALDGTVFAGFGGSGLVQRSANFLGWSNSGASTGTVDVNLSRQGVGVLQLGTTANNALGSLLGAAFTFSGATQTLSNAAFANCTSLNTTSNVIGCTASTAKVKENFGSFSAGLETLRKIRPQTFSYKRGLPSYDGLRADGSTRWHAGLIAENLQEANPLLVSLTNETGTGLLQPEPLAIQAVLINAINQLRERVEKLEAELKAAKARP